jgi:hypothetical protein
LYESELIKLNIDLRLKFLAADERQRLVRIETSPSLIAFSDVGENSGLIPMIDLAVSEACNLLQIGSGELILDHFGTGHTQNVPDLFLYVQRIKLNTSKLEC